ncbi:MAG: DUF378 domain-containing protein [Caloramator sp.]|nr:DUF378 domain-containing protein [Caloramator sp.]
MRILNLVTLAIVILGGVNWGFIAISGFDPLLPILGGYTSPFARIFYGIIGLSSIWVFYAYLMTPGSDGIEEK